MIFCYDKLWKILESKNMKKTDLIKEAGITSNSLARLGKNEDVRLEAIAKICILLDCKLDDIVEISQE
ncbi:MAG: helix-turn-helix domain-containing protein [Dorea sp.]